MTLLKKNPKLRAPDSVFTPRGQNVTEMYIPRSGLEEKLQRAMLQSKHIVVHGESGCGKSWLYKKVFSDQNVYYQTANLGRINGEGINGLLGHVLARVSGVELTGYSEKKSAKGKVVVAEGELSHEKKYEKRAGDTFQDVLKEMRRRAGGRPAALVFENLEHVLDNKEVVNELKGCLLLVDDNEYAQHKVRVLLVTTASDLRNYLAEVNSPNTVSNRLYEVPEVGRLVPVQAQRFVQRGLFELLGIDVKDNNPQLRAKITEWIMSLSDRIPQYLHELCLEIAFASESSGRILTDELVKDATIEWIRSSLVSEMTAVTSNLNSISTKKGRRNQLIYAIAHCDSAEFDYQKIEKVIRAAFPAACAGVQLSVSQGLSELASAPMPLIRRVPHGTSYRIVDPRYRILVRWVLIRNEQTEALTVRPFDKVVAL